MDLGDSYLKNVKRIFVDMDGPLVDFLRYCNDVQRAPEIVKKEVGAYKLMKPNYAGLAAVKLMIAAGLDVWILTKPPSGNASAWGDKAAWIMEHLPELERKLIITHDKSLVGDENDMLIDDRPHKANCHLFRGTFKYFDMDKPDQWDEILDLLLN